MTEQDPTPDEGLILIPQGEKLTFRSELFDVEVKSKHVFHGFTRDRHCLTVDLLETDPTVQRTATIEVPADVYASVGVGEKAKARLYQHPDRTWTTLPPAEAP